MITVAALLFELVLLQGSRRLLHFCLFSHKIESCNFIIL